MSKMSSRRTTTVRYDEKAFPSLVSLVLTIISLVGEDKLKLIFKSFKKQAKNGKISRDTFTNIMRKHGVRTKFV